MLPIIILSVFIIIFFVGIFIVGRQLPSHWEIEKAALIRARPEAIFPLLEQLRNWESWSVWNAEQTDSDIEYRGAEQGMGASLIWKVGRLQGQLTLTRSQSPTEIQYHLDINNGKFALLGTIFLSVTDIEFTQMAWRCTLRPPKHFQFVLRYQIYVLRNYFENALEESLLGMQDFFNEEVES